MNGKRKYSNFKLDYGFRVGLLVKEFNLYLQELLMPLKKLVIIKKVKKTRKNNQSDKIFSNFVLNNLFWVSFIPIHNINVAGIQ